MSCPVLVALAVAVSVAGCGNDKPKSVSPSATTTKSGQGKLVFFYPARLPADMAVDGVRLQRGQQEVPTWSAKLGRPNGAGRFRDIITAIVAKSPAPREVGERENQASRRVDVNGHSALEQDSPLGATVSWFQDGNDVGVIGPKGSVDSVLDVARALRLGARGDTEKTTLSSTPPGMEKLAEWGSGPFPRTRYSISALGGEARRGASLHLDVTVVPSGFPVQIAAAGFERDATRQVRGHDAYLFHQTSDIGGQTFQQVTLTWAERPDVVASLSGTITAEDVISVATGLREEDEQAWRSHLPVRDEG